METLIKIGEILGFITIWIAGVYLWGSVRTEVFGWRSSTQRKKRKRDC